ncbi:MAG: NAD(P)/FAD-dependent oxidoreductase, partial [Alphaproteobacteria bacterium]
MISATRQPVKNRPGDANLAVQAGRGRTFGRLRSGGWPRSGRSATTNRETPDAAAGGFRLPGHALRAHAGRRPAPPRPALEGVQRAEVCVIGGGLAGVNAALGLAERGRDVALIEAKRIGFGASGRNGGFLNAGFALPGRRLVARIGLERTRRLYAMTQDAVALVAARVERYRIACELARTGHMLASWFDDPAAIAAHRAWLADNYGVATELWPRERLREAYRTTRYFDGLYNPAGYQFHPLNYTLGVVGAAEAHGARLFERTPARGLERYGAGWRVITEHGAIDAEHVVVACGGYIGRFAPRIGRAILPIATYIIVTEPLGNRIDEVISVPYATFDDRFAQDYYRRLGDTRILWGGRISVRDAPSEAVQRFMLADLVRVYPQLRGVRVETGWGGLMSYA